MAKKALCLSGGATRGTFQMGAIKCLYEAYGFRPDIITGTSVGAINGIKLACAPPPAVNDSATILAAASAGPPDGQLKHMRELEAFWIPLNGRKDFFTIKPVFAGTPIEELLAENSPPGTPLGTYMDAVSAVINIPGINLTAVLALLLVAPLTASEVQKYKHLIENISVENSVAAFSPSLVIKITNPSNISLPALAVGTPLFMAMISLENGKLRYVTNKGEFFERDGVTPVATALSAADIAMALDENLQPLSTTRKNNITTAVTKYKTAVNQIAAYHPEFIHPNTSNPRKKVLAAAIERERERGNYYARAAKQHIKGVTVKVNADPIQAALTSSSLPVLLESPEIGVERYMDGGLREIIPIEIALSQNVSQIVGILCSTPELPETDSMKNVGLVEVGARAAMQIAISEVTQGDLETADGKGIDTRIIRPALDVHSGLDLKPSLIEISMHYGWLCAADEMQPVTDPQQREEFRQLSEILVRLRLKCLELEKEGASRSFRILESQKWSYFELRVNRWAIMHLAARRTALGLPAHPSQTSWSTDWEREFRGDPSIWAALDASTIGGPVPIWPASSPSAFNPDLGTIEDAGSDRIFWMVRGSLFEDKSGTALAAPSANVVMPNGIQKWFPRIPAGIHLMAETQAPSTVVLVAGGKKFSSPSAPIIAAAGLTGATVALVPTGGLAQIPDGGTPFFLGSLTVVDQHNITLSEVTIERVQGSNTTFDISIFNRSAATLTGISVVHTGFGAAQGITVENLRSSIPANTIDFFTLRLQPKAAGEFNGKLEINSSDTLFPKTTVDMKFKVLPLGDMANLDVTPIKLEINARVNSTNSYAMLTVTNSGGIAPATISASIEPADVQSLFVVGLYPGATAFTTGVAIQIPVFFYPTSSGHFNGELLLTAGGITSTNHPYQRTVRVPLVGHAGASTIRLLTRKPTVRDFEVDPGDIRRPRPRRDIPQTSLKINIGTIQPPVSSIASVFILNLGELDLEIPTMLGNYASVPLTQAFPINIGPGKWAEVRLDFGTYHAPGIGAFSETLRILSNDPVTQEAYVIIEGSVVGVKGNVYPDFIDFSNVAVNTLVQGTSAFENRGTVDLHINKIVWRIGKDFKLAHLPTLPYLVPPGGSLTLNIDFGPVTGPGFYGDSLILETSEGVAANLGVQAKAYL